MVRAPPPPFVLIAAVTLFVFYLFITHEHYVEMANPQSRLKPIPHTSNSDISASPPYQPKYLEPEDKVPPHLPPSVQNGGAIMGKLGNETLKAELGRAAWKLFHTTMARFPDKPTKDESNALKSYIYLFARLYPCGECAEHFQQIITRFPPQTSSRNSAAAWACFVHNQVNESKGKPIFDCSNIGDFYDCGCGDEEKEKMSLAGKQSDKIANGEKIDHEFVEIEREGEINGG